MIPFSTSSSEHSIIAASPHPAKGSTVGLLVVGNGDGTKVGESVGSALGRPVGFKVGAELVGLGVDVSIVGLRVEGACVGPKLGV